MPTIYQKNRIPLTLKIYNYYFNKTTKWFGKIDNGGRAYCDNCKRFIMQAEIKRSEKIKKNGKKLIIVIAKCKFCWCKIKKTKLVER
jgi:hypothetical protein